MVSTAKIYFTGWPIRLPSSCSARPTARLDRLSLVWTILPRKLFAQTEILRR